jgi:type IV secretion system protein VirB9
MSYKGCSSLAVCLLVAGTANANQDPGSPAPTATAAAPAASEPAATAQSEVPNIPSKLTASLAASPASPPPPKGIVPDPAAFASGPPTSGLQVQPVPTSPEDNCDTADCRAASDKPATTGDTSATSRAPVRIGIPAQQALSESYKWAENPKAVPALDPVGRVVFPYSESVPTIVCAPIHVCDIELQAGEVVQGEPHVGDAVRWRISPAASGSEDQKVTHLIVKPTEAGLDTNLIVPTDRHTYHIRLVSSADRYLSSVAFSYPDEHQRTWSEFTKTSTSSAGNSGDHGAGDMPTVAVNRLNFNYRIKVVKGKPEFKPLRAMDDGYHTYIAMNEEMPQQEAPVLIGISPAGEEQMINYRLKGNMYVADGAVSRLALISGAGKRQERIELTREECRQRGWLGMCWDPKE